MGYVASVWGGFGEALAAVAGALTGLLFVALSVKGAALSQSRALASRAAHTLVLFMTSVMIALTLVAPSQRRLSAPSCWRSLWWPGRRCWSA
jgi:hypothetical protein